MRMERESDKEKAIFQNRGIQQRNDNSVNNKKGFAKCERNVLKGNNEYERKKKELAYFISLKKGQKSTC